MTSSDLWCINVLLSPETISYGRFSKKNYMPGPARVILLRRRA